jgi:peptidyl-prolyl cis-trans isomerase B (cyclophilin B)
MPRSLLAPALVAAALTLAACGSSAKGLAGATTTTATHTTAAPARDSAGCLAVARPAPKGAGHLSKPHGTLSAARTYTVTLQTNCGPIVIRLDVSRAPKTTSSVAALVRHGFYDHLTFHRIVPGFVIQGGDPLGTGLGGPGYTVVEPPPSTLKYTRGVVAMAKTQTEPSGTSGSQFFIVTAKNAGLPAQYALVGRVLSGLGTVAKISAEPTDAQGAPGTPVVIEKATLSER